MGKVLRASAVLAQLGIATEEGTVPTSKQAKLVSKLLNERRADQRRKPKKVRGNLAGAMKVLW